MIRRILSTSVKDKVGVSKATDFIKEAYDYVIVGAGAAGNVLANRLTEDTSNKVLLLESGGDDAEDINVHVSLSEIDHGYKTVPQERACRGMVDRKLIYPRGHGLGGAGGINYLSYTRGSRHDFDEWAELGCEGWSYRDLLPYILLCEDNANKEYLKSGYHGNGGPMKVTDLAKTPLVEAFLNAGQQLGYSVLDVNGQNQLGFSNGQGYIYQGLRWSTVEGYLRPAMERSNLDVAVNSNVRKILFENRKVTGVEVSKQGQLFKVKANKEVILSAGTIESPRILMLSGIGPKDHLERLHIPVVNNLPVGSNLQDHPMCVLEYLIKNPQAIDIERLYKQSPEVQKYIFYKEGYLGLPVAQSALAFIRTRYAALEKQYPDIQLQLGNSLIGGIFRRTWNIKTEIWDSLYKHEGDPRNGLYIATMLLHPKSSGTIQLKSSNPDDDPLIDPKFLDKSEDARILVEGLKLQLQLQTTEAFQHIGAELSPKGLPCDHHQLLYSDEYLERFVRSQTLTGHHATGTCKMGALSDPSSVVDTSLKVIGVDGLRVVDASIMPKVPSGNTAAPTIMIAEKAADLIRGNNSVKCVRIPEEVLTSEKGRPNATGKR